MSIVCLLAMAKTIGCASIAPERGFSDVKNTYTRLRTNMLEENLDYCLNITQNGPSIYTQNDSKLQDENVKEIDSLVMDAVDIWLTQKSRKLERPNYNKDPAKKPVKSTRPKKLSRRLTDRDHAYVATPQDPAVLKYEELVAQGTRAYEEHLAHRRALQEQARAARVETKQNTPSEFECYAPGERANANYLVHLTEQANRDGREVVVEEALSSRRGRLRVVKYTSEQLLAIANKHK